MLLAEVYMRNCAELQAKQARATGNSMCRPCGATAETIVNCSKLKIVKASFCYIVMSGVLSWSYNLVSIIISSPTCLATTGARKRRQYFPSAVSLNDLGGYCLIASLVYSPGSYSMVAKTQRLGKYHAWQAVGGQCVWAIWASVSSKQQAKSVC